MYSMTAVCQLTGLNASTLRTWERRYGIPAPLRGSGNRRRYPAVEVDRLLAIAALIRKGHAIASLADLTLEALQALVGQAAGENAEHSAALALYRRAVDMLDRRDFVGFRARLVEALTLLQPAEAVEDVLAPVARHLGDAWSRGGLPIHAEHLATAIIRQVVSIAAGTRAPAAQHARLLFTTLAGDRHELGAIFAWYLALASGEDGLYLGPDLDTAEIEAAAEALDVDVVVLSLTPGVGDPGAVRARLERLAAALPQRRALWIGTAPQHPAQPQTLGAKARLFHDYRSFAAALGPAAQSRPVSPTADPVMRRPGD